MIRRNKWFNPPEDVELSLQLEENLKSTDFLDIHFNLSQESYSKFHKVNSRPTYIDTSSNPPKTIKQISNILITDAEFLLLYTNLYNLATSCNAEDRGKGSRRLKKKKGSRYGKLSNLGIRGNLFYSFL